MYILNIRRPFASEWTRSLQSSLAGALHLAWRKRQKDCSVGDITHKGAVVIDSQGVSQLLDEMDEILRAERKRKPPEVAEMIAGRIDEAGGAGRAEGNSGLIDLADAEARDAEKGDKK